MLSNALLNFGVTNKTNKLKIIKLTKVCSYKSMTHNIDIHNGQ